jgi:ribosomal protein S18 acetylase RimI-like enzyme
VALLHVAGIDQGFLPTLGVHFLALLYEAMDADPRSVLLVERSASGEVIGFVSGGRGMGSIYRHMLRRWPQLVVALLPSVLDPRKLKRIIEILWFSRQQKPVPGCPQSELFSIAVAGAARGTGVAQRLYKSLEAHFARQGEPAFCIVVGDTLAPAHRFYRKMGAVLLAHISVHAGQGSTVYRHDVKVGLSR